MPAHRKVSLEQIKMLLELLEVHPHLGLSRDPNGLVESKRSWQNIAKSLNEIPEGVTKTGKQWRSYWSELKYVIKKKARRTSNMVGCKLPLLTSLEKKVLTVIGRVEGLHDNIMSSLVPIGFNTLSVSSEVKAEFPESITTVKEATEASPQHVNLPGTSPLQLTESDNSQDSVADSVTPPTTENNQQDIVPRWMYELETRRVEAEERMAKALEKLANTVDTRLGALERTLLRMCNNHKNS